MIDFLWEYNTLVVLAGASLLGASAGLVGSFAVLRRRALTGDALAHAALPGLCLAFLAVGARSLPAMLAGALVSGLVGIAVISLLRRWTRVKEDTAIGIVLSVFFGAGIVLSRLIQNRSTAGSKAGLDTYILGSTAGMLRSDVYLIGGLAAVCVLLIVLLYKEFKLVAFDPDFARVQGWPALLLDLLLMALVAVTVVIGLPTVGVVLIAALLILPGVAARFWTDRLGVMLVISAAVGLSIGLVGTALSARFTLLPAGPVIVLVGSALFVVSLLFAPRRGALAKLLAQRRFQGELDERNLMRVLFELAEPHLPHAPAHTTPEIQRRRSWGRHRLRRLLESAEHKGHVVPNDGRYRLTLAGLRRAAQVVRAHRLWEAFLTEYPEAGNGQVDLAQESVDLLPPEMVADLSRRLRAAGRWPLSDILAQEEAAA